MRRAIALAAAVLMLPIAFTPVTPQANPPAPQSDPPAADYGPPRSTLLEQPARTTRPVTAEKLPLTLTVAQGDTYGAWAKAHCGTFTAWRSIQQANGWPERRIPVGKTATIVCTAATQAAPKAAPPSTTAPITNGTWMHPLASGKRAGHAGLCWGAARTGHSHKGVDLTMPTGTPIRAVAAGTIHFKAYGSTAGYYVTIAHGGNVFSRYMHLRAHSPLSKGAKVQAGQTIGHVGATGNAKGPHLHFEILVGGRNTNPAPFMRGKGINIGC